MSYLRNALSLDTAGGIYFEGARVSSDERQLVLFIGLGGTGGDALLRIKNQVSNRMKLPMNEQTHMPTAEVPKNIAFLEFDTDSDVMKKTCGNTTFAPHNKEYCPLGVEDTAVIISEVKEAKKRGAEEWQWIDDNLKANQGSAGAGGIRQVGRLMLFRNISTVTTKLQNTITQLSIDNPTARKLQIIVFSGISGGTGAGTFVDMGYICTKIGKAMMTDTQVLGYLLMSDVNEGRGGQKEKLRTNCFAGLKEIDHLLVRATQDGVFHQKYNHSFTVDTNKAPYNHCHILNGSDTAGHIFSYDGIMKTLAENAFAYVAGEVIGNEPAMKSNYDNIAGYLVNVASNADYPATYRFLSVGASSLKIPYTEISTLLACRMFTNLERTMFSNRPTDITFNKEDLPNLGYTEQSFMSYLTAENPRQPDLSTKTYSWDDIFRKGDRPRQAIFGNGCYIATCQAMMAKRRGEAIGEFEGRFREYLKNNIANPQKGPIYLARMVDSNENPCLLKTLRSWRERCISLRNQCIDRRSVMEQESQKAYNEGREKTGPLGIFKVDCANRYLIALQQETENFLYGDIYASIVDVFDKVIGRLEVYQSRILKRLADTLLEMPVIFNGNLEYLMRADRDYHLNPDDSMLIYPMDFERRYQSDFNSCVIHATNGFLDQLKNNLRFWVGRDIDSVDDNVSSGEDIVGFLANFVSDSFKTLYNAVSMEKIMDQMRGADLLDVFVQQKTAALFNTAYSMYKSRAGIAVPTSEFTILSVPNGNPNLVAAATSYVRNVLHDPRIIIKQSSENDSMNVVKVTAGYPLYSNAFIYDLEQAYEVSVSTPESRMGVHLIPEWVDLPSPIVESSWIGGYRCERTKKRNAQVRKDFLRCFGAKIIYENDGPDVGTATLLLADPAVDLNHLALVGTTANKKSMLQSVRRRLWDFNNPTTKVKLESCSTYKRTAEEQYGMNGVMQNICENTLRFPELCQVLREQTEKLEKMAELDNNIENPAYFARALLLGLIYVDPVTKDVSLRKHPNDPMPKRLLDGFAYNLNDADAYYKIYEKVRDSLDQKVLGANNASQGNWRAIIDNSMRNQMNIFRSNPQVMVKFKNAAAMYERRFQEMANRAYQESLSQYADASKKLENVSQHYVAVAEEYSRLKLN